MNNLKFYNIKSLDSLIKTADKIPGGKGDNLPHNKIPKDEFNKGLEIESEHSPDPEIEGEIVADHEQESIEMLGRPEYYKYLEKMEDTMKEDGKKDKEKKSLIRQPLIRIATSEVIMTLDEDTGAFDKDTIAKKRQYENRLNGILNYIDMLNNYIEQGYELADDERESLKDIISQIPNININLDKIEKQLKPKESKNDDEEEIIDVVASLQEVTLSIKEIKNIIKEALLFRGEREKKAYVEHKPGHKNSKGESAPWVIVDHDNGKIVSSHKTKDEAKSHLRDMKIHENAFIGFRNIEALLKKCE